MQLRKTSPGSERLGTTRTFTVPAAVHEAHLGSLPLETPGPEPRESGILGDALVCKINT